MIKAENGQVEVSGRKKEIERDLIGVIRTINISCTEKGQSKEKNQTICDGCCRGWIGKHISRDTYARGTRGAF